MKAVIKKWGSSAAVRLPAAALMAANLAIGQSVEVEMYGGTITIRAVAGRRRSLEELIAATPSFGRSPGWFGEDVGRERDAFGE